MTATEYFGQIALLLTLLAAATGVLRGALGTPLLLTAGRPQSDIRREGSFAVTSALLVSPIVGGVMWAVEGSGIRLPTMLIIAATPIVLVEDVLRYVAIAQGRPHVAALCDGVWFLGSAALLVATWFHLPVATTGYLIGGWTGLAFLALVGMLVAVRIAPALRQYPGWICDGWQDRARYGAESGLEQTTAFAVLLFAAVVLSPEVTAALRGATALLAPIAIAASAIPLVLIPESKRLNMAPRQVWNSLARIALITTAGSILLGVALFFMPVSVGELVLGRTFGATQAIAPIIALEYAIGAWIIAVTIFLRTFNRSADALKLKVGYVLVVLVMVLGGGVLFRTAGGVAAGIATATTFTAAVALLRFKPWATPASPFRTERLQPVARSEAAGAFAGAYLLNTVVPRPIPLATRLRLQETAQLYRALITLWCFATLAVFVPVAIIRFTGIPTSSSWLWSVPMTAICAARLAWLIGNGERRLFELMFWGYSYAFLCLAPLAQLRENHWPNTVPRVDVTCTTAAALMVIVGCCAFLAGAGLDNVTSVRRCDHPAKRTHDTAKQRFTVNYRRTMLLCVFAIVTDTYYISQVGWLLFLKSRYEVSETERAVWPHDNLGVIMRACSYMALLVAFVALMHFRKEAKSARMGGENISTTVMRSSMALLVIVGILLANSMNPISNARYLSGTAILAAATVFGLFATRRRFRITACGFLAGMLVIFPLADAFRVSRQAELKSTSPIQSLLSADYDSFAELMNGYLVAARDGIVPGKQFSGVLLFWLPRSLWTHKPVDTGIYIANVRGYSFTNLSAPLWIEFYLNGGWVLLAVAMLALGFGLHRWDTRLNAQFDLGRIPGVLGCILPFYLMILLRGSLLQATSFLFFILAFSTFVQRTKANARPRAPTVPFEPPPAFGVEHLRTNYARA
ncbi:MAG: hypothetical protein ACRDTK_01185 [Mycobacterium sp.]